MTAEQFVEVLTAPFRVLADVIRFDLHPLASLMGLLWVLKIVLASAVTGRTHPPKKDAPPNEATGNSIWGFIDDLLLFYIVGFVVALSPEGLGIMSFIMMSIGYGISMWMFIKITRQPWYVKVIDDGLALVLLGAYALVRDQVISLDIVADALRSLYVITQ